MIRNALKLGAIGRRRAGADRVCPRWVGVAGNGELQHRRRGRGLSSLLEEESDASRSGAGQEDWGASKGNKRRASGSKVHRRRVCRARIRRDDPEVLRRRCKVPQRPRALARHHEPSIRCGRPHGFGARVSRSERQRFRSRGGARDGPDLRREGTGRPRRVRRLRSRGIRDRRKTSRGVREVREKTRQEGQKAVARNGLRRHDRRRKAVHHRYGGHWPESHSLSGRRALARRSSPRRSSGRSRRKRASTSSTGRRATARTTDRSSMPASRGPFCGAGRSPTTTPRATSPPTSSPNIYAEQAAR